MLELGNGDCAIVCLDITNGLLYIILHQYARHDKTSELDSFYRHCIKFSKNRLLSICQTVDQNDTSLNRSIHGTESRFDRSAIHL
jgi:hypothetical protein